MAKLTVVYAGSGMCLSKKAYVSWREVQADFDDYKASLRFSHIDELFEFLGDDFPGPPGLPFTRTVVSEFLVGNDTVLWSREYCDPLTDNYPVEAAGDLVDVLRSLRHDLRRSEYTWENPSLDRYIEALCRHLETHAEGAQWAEWANLATSFKAARRNNGLTSTSALRAGIPTGDQLSASWRTDHDGTGVLTLECSSQGFAGTADAWFGRQHLLSFAASLSQFPVPTEGISLSGGMGAEDSYREQIGIVVAPLGNRGQIDVRLHLANEVWPGNPPEGSYETTLHLLTTYGRLAEFASEFIRSIEFGATDAAVLRGERLD